MDPQNYPGHNLSLSQLIFALNENLKRTAHLPSIIFDQVSQLDQDALSTVIYLRNFSAPINRIPPEILELIPTYLSSHDDRLRASFVCRHWRRTFVQCGDLWSELLLSNGKVYTKTFLERAKGSMLDISGDPEGFSGIWSVLASHTEQIRCLNFVCWGWLDIQKAANIMSRPLPLLHTLTINDSYEDPPLGETVTHPPLPLFSNATNLKELRLYSKSSLSPLLGQFTFPNLVSFYFSAMPLEDFLTSQLLDFLEASPMLQIVQMAITTFRSFEDIPQERVVVLPSVKSFALIMGDYKRVNGYDVAAHISCPSVRHTSFVHEGGHDWDALPGDIFPDPVDWSAVVSRYMRRPIEEVELKIETNTRLSCKLTFRPSDASIVEFSFITPDIYDNQVECWAPPLGLHSEVFTQAARTIRDHPQVKNIKRLHIYPGSRIWSPDLVKDIASQVRQLFESLDHLDEFFIYHGDLRPFFYCNDSNKNAEEQAVFPPTKELTISHPLLLSDEQLSDVATIAESQRAMGKPFGRVVIRGLALPAEVRDRLKQCVDGVKNVYEPVD